MIQNIELNKQYQRIETLIHRTESVFEPDDELLSEMAKYICVVCSGFLENTLYEIFSDYVKKETSSSTLISYSEKCLSKIQNPKKQAMIDLSKSFNPIWGDELDAFLDQEERGSSINYIITERHRIAHGDDSQITIGRIKIHLKRIQEVVEFIENMTNKPSR